jgi:4-hydroxybenzoate polyprenyltransferase
LGVTTLTTALSLVSGRGGGAVWVALAVLCGQLSVGWCNDYVDSSRDAAAGRRDKPIVTGDISARAVGVAAVTSLALVVPLSLLSGWRAALVHAGAVAAAWLYNVWLKSTWASPVAYALAFGSLPAFVTLGLPDAPMPPAWAVLAGALLGTGAHFLNALPDLDDDRATGVRGLPHRVGATGSALLGPALMAAAAVVLAVAPPGSPAAVVPVLLVAALLADVAALVTARLGLRRVSWPLTILGAVLTVALLLAQGDVLTR